MEHLLTLFPTTMSGTIYWKMGGQYVKQYADDLKIKIFELQTKTLRWWQHGTAFSAYRFIN
jgi:hypothetical protein